MKEFHNGRKDKIYCSERCYSTVYRVKTKHRDSEKRRQYNRNYRIRKGLKGRQVSIYKYCPHCKGEYLKTSDHWYIGQRSNRQSPQYHCKKYSKERDNRNSRPEIKRAWKKRHPEQYKIGKRITQNSQTERLTDGYIKRVLKMKDAPKGLIELKKYEIKIKRSIKNNYYECH